MYGIKIIGHVLCVVFILLYGLNPFTANPSLTYLPSNSFQASESVGCLITPSFVQPVACHFILVASSGDKNRHCNLGFKGNQCKTFATFFFCLMKHVSYPLHVTQVVSILEAHNVGKHQGYYFPSNAANSH